MSRRFNLLVTLALVAIFAIAACGDDTATGDPGAHVVDAEAAVAMIEAGERTILDVRTPAEFDESHIVGALNIDVQAADFSEHIAELDVKEPYLVYCHSGNRSARAAEQMESAGFVDTADAGGLADLASAGAPIE
jgi:phage shock protein E